MVDRVEIFRDDKGIVVLQLLKNSHLSVIPGSIYDFADLKKWMCELCMFLQIRSHIMQGTAYSQCAKISDGALKYFT